MLIGLPLYGYEMLIPERLRIYYKPLDNHAWSSPPFSQIALMTSNIDF